MAQNTLNNNPVTLDTLQDGLKDVLEGMCKLHIPDAEIQSILQNTFEDIASSRNRNRNYKDALFRMLFRSKKELLSLYNALNDSDYDNPDDLQVMTLDKYWFIGIKNDVAFAIMSELYVIEQQSTICNNMPLRNLFYITETYRTMVRYNDLYKQKLVKILEPHFITFYNGSRNMKEDVQELRLSDAFERVSSDTLPAPDPELQLIVHVYNINAGHNEKLLARCPILKEYMDFINIVRTYTNDRMTIDNAVANAIHYSIKHNILADFLTKNKDEVMAVVCTEYTFEDYKTETDTYIQETLEQIKGLENELAEKNNALAEKDNALAEKDNALAEKDNALAEKDNALAEKDNLIKVLQEEISRLRQ